MAAIINPTIGYAGKLMENGTQETVLTPYMDKDAIDDWAREAMAFTLQKGLMQGVTDSKLDPDANATRAQAAVMLKRLLVYMQYIT